MGNGASHYPREGGHPTDCPSLINPAAAHVVGEMRQKLANYPTERESKSEEEVGRLAGETNAIFPPETNKDQGDRSECVEERRNGATKRSAG